MLAKRFDERQWSKLQTVLGHYLFFYSYWLFRSWGRIGTTIGGNKLEKKYNLQEALHQFEYLFLEKTANYWASKKHFHKVPGRFFLVDLDYNQVNFYCVCA